jgi:hypothetical protein
MAKLGNWKLEMQDFRGSRIPSLFFIGVDRNQLEQNVKSVLRENKDRVFKGKRIPKEMRTYRIKTLQEWEKLRDES